MDSPKSPPPSLASARPGQRDLTTGPIGKSLLAFALPTLGSSILQSLNGSINSVWVGRLIGEDALAAALALFLGSGSPALPIARHIQLLTTWSFLMFGVTLVLFGTVRANGAAVGPLIILAIGLVPVRLGFAILARPWLGADALWLSFPVSSISNLALATAYYLHGGWKKARMVGPPPSDDECVEQAETAGEPGGRISPSA